MNFWSWLWGPSKTLGSPIVGDPVEYHGHLGNKDWDAPRAISLSNEHARSDQGNTIESSEYQDSSEVLEAKVDLIIQLLQKANCCTVYTGAGLSRASGIPDYASKSTSITNKVKPLKNNFDAKPTRAHRVLVALERAGYIHNYVQQNHDGLPQKAGFPQEKINEIHGAWYDPSNPVVAFSGKLRTDIFKWMVDIERKTDLCLCLGTSLSGMNADRVAETPAYKSLESETVLGTVIINLQRTRLDSKCAVRVWACLDDVFALLAKKLQLDVTQVNLNIPGGCNDQFIVPYNEMGLYDENCEMIWDLRDNAKIVVVNPDSCIFPQTGSVFGKDEQGHYIVHFNYREFRLGKWWIATAMNGKWPYHLPFINENPTINRKTPTTL